MVGFLFAPLSPLSSLLLDFWRLCVGWCKRVESREETAGARREWWVSFFALLSPLSLSPLYFGRGAAKNRGGEIRTLDLLLPKQCA